MEVIKESLPVFKVRSGGAAPLPCSFSAEHGREESELEPVLLLVRPNGIKL